MKIEDLIYNLETTLDTNKFTSYQKVQMCKQHLSSYQVNAEQEETGGGEDDH